MSVALVEWVPDEWRAWTLGMGRCPYCVNVSQADFEAICDCWQVERERPLPATDGEAMPTHREMTRSDA